MNERCPNCGIPVGRMPEDATTDEMFCNSCYEIFDAEQKQAFAKEWSGSCDPCDPANYWIDDVTGERVNAATNERTQHTCE